MTSAHSCGRAGFFNGGPNAGKSTLAAVQGTPPLSSSKRAPGHAVRYHRHRIDPTHVLSPERTRNPMSRTRRGSLLRSACAVALVMATLALIPGSAVGAGSTRTLQTVTVPGYRLGVRGTGWGTGRVVLTAQVPSGVVGVELRPASGGSFLVAASNLDLCGGVQFAATDTAGHTGIARGPTLMCPSPLGVPPPVLRPVLHVLQGGKIIPRQYRLRGPNHPSSLRMRVGDSLSLWEPGTTAPAFTPRVDGKHLVLLKHDQSSSQTCTTSGCATGFAWTWVAVAAGQTAIDLSPACRQSRPACGMPDYAITVHIDP